MEGKIYNSMLQFLIWISVLIFDLHIQVIPFRAETKTLSKI